MVRVQGFNFKKLEGGRALVIPYPGEDVIIM
jgi:hypothetical protein